MRAREFGACGSTSAMQEDVLFGAWSKNTAGNSNYGLRGAGECVFYAWSKNKAYSSIYGLRGAGECVFYAWSKNTAGNSNYGLRGAGECVVLRLEQEHSRQQQLRPAWCW